MLMQRGMMDRQGQVMPGLQDILKRLRAMKEQQLRQYDPNSALDDLQRQLDDIVARERQTLEAQLQATRQRLEGLPTDTDPETAQQRANEARAVQEMEELVAERRAQLEALPRDVGDYPRLQQYDFRPASPCGFRSLAASAAAAGDGLALPVPGSVCRT